MRKEIIFGLAAMSMVSSCMIIRPGEAGIKQTLGKMNGSVVTQGAMLYNPFISKIVVTSIQTNTMELTMSLPSKEGLSVNSVISILYKADKNKLQEIIRDLGLDFEGIISNVFRSAAADVCANYFAKDMHSGMRGNIEQAIKEKMNEVLNKRGLIIDAVLMKSIQLPAGLATSIESKLQAEQDALRMEFILKQERSEAERKIIAAQGERDAQKILSEGLTEQIIKIRSIEAFNKLSESPNTKIIITDGKTPMLIQDK